MNYSEKKYGRTIIRNHGINYKRFWMALGVSCLVGLGTGIIATNAVNALTQPKEKVVEATTTNEPSIILVDDNKMLFKSDVEENFKALDVPMNKELQKYIYNLSTANGLDFTLVMSLIEHESSFQSDVISSTNDYGLMQINAANHEWLKEKLNVEDFLNPYENVRCGVYILANLFEKYEDASKALMAYNMGEAGASSLWNQGIYETKYSESILEKCFYFNKQLAGDSND